MTEKYNRTKEGNPIGFLKGEVLPGASILLGEKSIFSVKLTGHIIELDGKKYFEISKSELL
ncbi:MAG: hypothetical protein D5R97_01765 [Candidatus Syntrophonatronum acetioxidans]|uniref:Uncharacterized protein n=1 Tax=Candidatus Syntrophonatronum acetioxidans TaxID=1795816 RepID=A0A424YHJ1_9FIRM|nr:MAG: hypothetical protein D5R97_01765 [Candidatus Syntrophonatronum acetioxidans]